jgi:hypothetical protein
VLVLLALSLPLTLRGQNKSSPATKPSAKPAKPAEDPQLYRNATYGFRYTIPYGWVDRSQQMKEGSEPGKSELLLAVFQHPPEATGDTINSAVVIATESVTSYPGLKRAEDYVGPLTDLATAGGFKTDGEPYALEVESRSLIRADFVKTLDGKTIVGQTPAGKTPEDKLTMRQCTLVMLSKGQIVSFTFIASDEDELDDLMDGLHFTVATSPRKSP